MKYCVFIISHERAGRVASYDVLKSIGYAGEIYVVIDDEDSQINQYEEKYPIIMYHKNDFIGATDTIFNNKLRESLVYALNAVEQVARQHGYDAFVVLDDDISRFKMKLWEERKYRSYYINRNMDKILDAYVEYILESGITVLSFEASSSDIMREDTIHKFARKARNTCYQIYVRNVSKPVEWKGLIQVNKISTLLSAKEGNIWWSLPNVLYDSFPMNKDPGGMKSTYDALNDYKKCFPVIMTNPSCVEMRELFMSRAKVNVFEDPDASYPMIVSSRYKK